MAEVLTSIRRELAPTLAARRTAMPVVPDGARVATLNVNGHCAAVLDRRFLPDEPLDELPHPEARHATDRVSHPGHALKDTPISRERPRR